MIRLLSRFIVKAEYAGLSSESTVMVSACALKMMTKSFKCSDQFCPNPFTPIKFVER